MLGELKQRQEIKCVWGWEGREMTQNYSDQRKTSCDHFKNGTVLRRKSMAHLPWLSTSPEIFATKRGGGRQTQMAIFFWFKNIL